MLAQARDGLALRGDLVLHPIRWHKEIERDREGRIAEAPPCFLMEHRGGVCPLGLKHDTGECQARNTVVDGFYGAILDALAGVASPASLLATYVAAGTGNAATTAGMTKLGAESYRAVWTDRQRPTTTSAVLYFFFGTTVANTFMHEFGAFAGAATGAADSGLLVGRWLFDFNKDSSTTLNGQYTVGKA